MLPRVSIIRSSSGSILCSLLKLQFKTLSKSLGVLNCNFSQEQSMLPEDDRMIETCRSVLMYHHHHHHHHISVMQLGHLLTRSGLTYPEVSSMVCHDSFCQLWE